MKYEILTQLETSFGDIEEKGFKLKIMGSSNGKPFVGQMAYQKMAYEDVLVFGIKDLVSVKTSKLKMDAGFEMNAHYSYNHDKNGGAFSIGFGNNTLQLSHTDYESPFSHDLVAKVVPGESLSIEEKWEGKTAMSYNTKRTTKRTADVLELTLESKMTLTENSLLFRFLVQNSFESFKTRMSKIQVFVDKKNSTKVAPKFKIQVKLQKDGNDVADFDFDTTVSPYRFKFGHISFDKFGHISFEKRYGEHQYFIEVTVDHQVGSSMAIDINTLGGIHIFTKHEDKTTTGQDMSLVIKQGDTQIFKL